MLRWRIIPGRRIRRWKAIRIRLHWLRRLSHIRPWWISIPRVLRVLPECQFCCSNTHRQPTYRIMMGVSTMLRRPRLWGWIWLRCSWVWVLALTTGGLWWRRIRTAIISCWRPLRRLCCVVGALVRIIRRRVLRPLRVSRVGHLRHVERWWWVIQVSEKGNTGPGSNRG